MENLIIKYLNKKVTEAEKQHIENLLETSPDFRSSFNEIKIIWESSLSFGDDFEPDLPKAWLKIKEQTTEAKKTRTLSWFKYTVAAMLMVGLLFFYPAMKDLAFGAEVYTSVSRETPIKLIDGTLVWLNNDASLTTYRTFNKKKRRVTLTGEAFFEVSHNPEKPFIIQAGKTQTQVLGTSFNVNFERQTNDVTVAVATGKVAFGVGQTDLKLTPGHIAKYDQLTDKLELLSQNNTNAMSWKTKDFEFVNTSLPDALNTLSHAYNQDISFITSKLNTLRITGDFHQMDIDQILEIIGSTHQLAIEKKDGIYLIEQPNK